jgi:hypothetical protein
MRVYFLFFSFLFIATAFAQNLKHPAQFLGYTIGTKYTPHHKIVDYFNHVATNSKTNVQVIEYGKTNEGRPLIMAFVSSDDNIKNLDAIQKANLSRAKLLKEQVKSNVGIVWLSYNVHGNEPSSSEAAMLTIYELITQHTNDWLKNTVVIIDPCLNPDGRDKYVNWFNATVGDFVNINPNTAEHDEPWPGGRVNHYYFDLNRDWAWQTQVETQQRIKLYNKWLPQVHVDFHEQGFNEPYYFAPAAEPLHEVITPWQKEFQNIIGKNNAKYFDNNGWYYFTKERFDLFYPSYGDTYPTFNGSIGMTYEQGGHSKGGLSVQMDNGDTLTLVDRALHHHTTGLSTVEMASVHNSKMITAFETYFENSNNAVGSDYKTYILSSNTASNIKAIEELLFKNDIQYTKIYQASGLGYNYETEKYENIVTQQYAISVSAFQPKSLLAKVLLEPKSKLNDSVTYDITAWSLPYLYGVKAYASKEVIKANPVVTKKTNTLPQTNYAYFIPYTSINEAQLLATLTKANIKVYINEKEITHNNKTFGRGTLMIPKKDNLKKWNTVEAILNQHLQTIEVIAVASGFAQMGSDMGSPDNKFIAAPRIACITGDGTSENAVGEIWHYFDREIKYPISMINSNTISSKILKKFDVLVLANGNHSFLSNKNVKDELKQWIEQGGRVVAIEGGALQMLSIEQSTKLKTEEPKEETIVAATIKKYENRERADITDYIAGAIYEVALDISHPLAFGYDKKYYTLKRNTDVIKFNKAAWNVGVLNKNKPTTGFAGANAIQKIQDGCVIQVQDVGAGAIIYFIDNPIFRDFWHSGKLMLFNACFLVGNNANRL